MEKQRDLKQLMDKFKDKASLIKATLSTKRTVSSIDVAVIRATTHKRNTAPPNHRVSALLSLGDHSFLVQSVCIDAILHRLHKTRSPYVALKCLLIIHNIISKSFSIFKKQLTLKPLAEGTNPLNLSSFQNDENEESFELSAWVRWYACVVECNLVKLRFFGVSISSSRNKNVEFRNDDYYGKEFRNDDYYGKEYLKVDSILVKEINYLVLLVEEICKVPDSLRYMKNDVVHDVMMLVGKDYRSTQHQIMHRLGELDGRVNRLTLSDSSELVSCLRRLEGCRGRLTEMFRNRMKNVDFWELVGYRKKEVLDNGNTFGIVG
ncbi:vesicle coat protein [Lithospermum erythrorhizon]|uniref:Vesicle coat protein n=1 Tax=Lithospermum erythrorhizon TaxID=34254 RepID=A0AAV3NWC4_LITER